MKYFFKGGWNRTGVIEFCISKCSICNKETYSIVIDASEHEYESGCVCIECIKKHYEKELGEI